MIINLEEFAYGLSVELWLRQGLRLVSASDSSA